MNFSQRTYFSVLILTFLVLSVVVTTEVYAQQSTSSQTEWFKTIGIYDEELVNALIPTSDGGYAVAGIASSPSLSAAANQPVSYFWLVKIDSSGEHSMEQYLSSSRKRRGRIFSGSNFRWRLRLNGNLDTLKRNGSRGLAT